MYKVAKKNVQKSCWIVLFHLYEMETKQQLPPLQKNIFVKNNNNNNNNKKRRQNLSGQWPVRFRHRCHVRAAPRAIITVGRRLIFSSSFLIVLFFFIVTYTHTIYIYIYIYISFTLFLFTRSTSSTIRPSVSIGSKRPPFKKQSALLLFCFVFFLFGLVPWPVLQIETR